MTLTNRNRDELINRFGRTVSWNAYKMLTIHCNVENEDEIKAYLQELGYNMFERIHPFKIGFDEVDYNRVILTATGDTEASQPKPVPDSRDPECIERWPECESGVFETVGGTKGASGMTPDEEIDFMCERFEAADCEVALETCTIGLNIDIADRQPYTLLPGALDRMRAAYKRRLAELRELAE